MIAQSLLLLAGGAVLANVVKTLNEPTWAREVLANISISRVMPDGEHPLVFEFIGTGGWITAVSSDYIGWRNTEVGKGDSDAWVCIWKRPDDTWGFDVYGTQLVIFYNGIPLEPRTGEYLHSYRL